MRPNRNAQVKIGPNSNWSLRTRSAAASHVLSAVEKSESVKKREAKKRKAEKCKQLDDCYMLSEIGLAVHYLKENSKNPLEKGWTTAPLNTPDDLIKKHRSKLNLGVRLGKPSKVGKCYLYCLDLDIRCESSIVEANSKLCSLIPEFNTLPCVVSGSGGASRHYYFFTTLPLVSKKIARSAEQIVGKDSKLQWKWEIEFFGTGKQTVLPPSTHPVSRKQYCWERRFNFSSIELGFYPEIPAERVQSWFSTEAENALPLPVKLPLHITEFEIDEVMKALDIQKFCDDREGWIKVGMALHHQYQSSEEGYERWCAFSEQSDRFNEPDQRRVWKSFKGKSTIYTFASLIYQTRDVRTVAEFDEILEDLDPEQSNKSSAKKHPALKFHAPGQIDQIPEPHDFVEGLLYESQISVFFGPPGSGKTFFLLDLVAHVVLGRIWQGNAVDPVPVLYIALEGSSGMKRRRLAWCKCHEIGDPNTLAIHFADGFLDIREGAITRGEIIDYALEYGIKWIIIDTLSRAMAGGEESGAKDMGAAFLGADEIRRLSGAHVTLVHHTGKDQTKGGRGSSLLVGNIDTEVQITRNGTNRTARLTKQKEGEDGTEWQFKIEQVDLGYRNNRGKPVTSAVAITGMADEFMPVEDGTTAREKSAFGILLKLALQNGATGDDSAQLVSKTDFRLALRANKWPTPGASQSAFKMAFFRMIDTFKNADKILIKNNNIEIVT